MIFILFVLVIIVSVVEPVVAIHNLMTRAERLEIFGDEESVPEYQLYPIDLPGARQWREFNDEIKLTVEIKGKKYNLNFKPTEGKLISRYTPVWLAITDRRAYMNIRYEPLPEALGDIGDFKMYRDVDHEAAITVYDDNDEGIIISGVVTSYYAIKSLPQRLIGETLKLGDYFVKTSQAVKKRFAPDQPGNYKSCIALVKIPPKANNSRLIDDQVLNFRKKRQASRRGNRRKTPPAVYPEILLILDYNAIRKRTITEALRFMLAFWNAVDLVYSALDKPKVYLNIAGIIIAADETATPYIAETATIKVKAYARKILSDMGFYFFKEQVRFPKANYDVIIGMTTMKMCREKINPCIAVQGYANGQPGCAKEVETVNNIVVPLIRNTAIVHYNWLFSGVNTAVHESAHLFGVDHDMGYGVTVNCDYKDGYVMAVVIEYAHQSFKWSKCSKAYFHDYFDSEESNCLHNEPLWMKPVDEILPGRWLTLDGQCRNAGYEYACKIPRMPIYMAMGCEIKGTNDCFIHEYSPLPGSNYGETKYCNSRSTCVDDYKKRRR